ncbi:MAG: hypothetical protein H0W72_07035 [Planctomycetes bacterium]|nr:hypothetical protein [Planctomycetota bacterium]
MTTSKPSRELSMRTFVLSATIIALAGCGGGGGGGSGGGASVAAGGPTSNFGSDPVNTITSITVNGTTTENALVTGNASNPGGGTVAVADAPAVVDMVHSIPFAFDGATLQADPGYVDDLAFEVVVDGVTATGNDVSEFVVESPQ